MHPSTETLIFEGDTQHEHYQVVDMVYEGRPARVLFSGHRAAAQSGLPLDGVDAPLFDYNKRLMELMLGLQPKRVLVIGGGVYTLPMALLQRLHDIHIDAVELDPGLQGIAEKYFGLTNDSRLRIIHGDGREYLAQNQRPYDAIVIDAFIHDVIPQSLSDQQAAVDLFRNSTADGVVAVNIISTYRGHRSKVLHEQHALYAEVFTHVHVFPAESGMSTWQLQNFILTAQKTAGDISSYLRFQPINL